MLINETRLARWMQHFYGYGRWDAPFWFIAHEEGGGDLPEEVAEKIDYFDAHHSKDEPSLCDLRTLYSNVRFRAEGRKADTIRTLHDYRFGPKATLHGLWKNLISFVHGYRNDDTPELLTYQKKKFASSKADEALITLYPLPSPHNHAWYYGWLDAPSISFIRNRQQYETHLFSERIATIIDQMIKRQPEVVVMYGMTNINQLRTAFQDRFEIKFRQEKAVPRKIPQHHYARIGKTKLIITTQTPTLRHNRIESGFDWYMTARQIADYT